MTNYIGGTTMTYGGDDAFDGRHDGERQPTTHTGQEPGTPDTDRPGTSENTAADQRH
ncbi:hypothetical protein AB0425_17260 [Actinosynnema sp. NPDC051121]